MIRRASIATSLAAVAGALACSAPDDEPAPGGVRGPSDVPLAARSRLSELSPAELPPPPPDPSNQYLDDPRAADLGKKFFFDTRFSGPLLDEANNGTAGTLGLVGEAGKVACASCHVPDGAFTDVRSPRHQISLGAGWTRRRAPSLLNVAQATFLMWDGRRDTAFSQPFTPLEDPIEINSSRLFVAQQIQRLYRGEYEAIFGPMPALDAYAPIAPEEAGCSELPVDVAHGRCEKPGQDDPDVTRVVVNFGKAIQAFTRRLSCGKSRFDAWMDGDASALTADEQAGALLFVGKGACDRCHRGPYLTDQTFHNVGLQPSFAFFVGPLEDPGASAGLAAMKEDPLNSAGPFSDGYDGRLEQLPEDVSRLLGAFRTPSLRCVSRRPSFTHTGQYRSLYDVVAFFNNGGDASGFLGVSELMPLGLTAAERDQIVAFLKALDGEGPDPALMAPPELPPDPAL